MEKKPRIRGQTLWIQPSVMAFPSCVALGKSPNFSEVSFSFVKWGQHQSAPHRVAVRVTVNEGKVFARK